MHLACHYGVPMQSEGGVQFLQLFLASQVADLDACYPVCR
jgi:hypothetical protein